MRAEDQVLVNGHDTRPKDIDLKVNITILMKRKCFPPIYPWSIDQLTLFEN